MGAFILLLHVAGWGTLLGIVARQHLSIGNSVFGFGIGLAAYALGMRHAFDADHIAAIDNTTRKIMQTGKRPLSVGFWFSFGHSTVVFVLALLLAFGVKSIAAPVLDDKFSASSNHGPDRHDCLERLSLRDRHFQSYGSIRHHQSVSPDAARPMVGKRF
ncbi:MAG: hypothetical protein WDN02_18095 [Methylovirgula sp.]|uniref:HoxN/HupN/NixA family nickel/cobalt transporter n=1 Tax=Methylovirgula sp. TaxID=1978224 RepID=UPI0030762E5B